MNHKASAECKNGHSFEFGSCSAQVKKLFGGTKDCSCKRFEQIYNDGRTTIVSFDNMPWNAVVCLECKTEHTSRPCPHCGEILPITAFKKKGLFSKLS
jgi:hypothetical protein